MKYFEVVILFVLSLTIRTLLKVLMPHLWLSLSYVMSVDAVKALN